MEQSGWCSQPGRLVGALWAPLGLWVPQPCRCPDTIGAHICGCLQPVRAGFGARAAMCP